MKKCSSKGIKPLDRLSELPDSLIFSIFGFLPMSDVVATSILSKRWRYLWTTTPYLNFDDDTLSAEAKFITPTLMIWRGTKILKLNIHSAYPVEQYLSRDVDLWLRFAKDYQVQELYLHLVDVYSGNDEYYRVPQFLFSLCPSLKVLSLDVRKIDINRNVQWDQLTSLTIRSEAGLRCDDINRVLDGSPKLEVLVLRFCDVDEHLTIRSTSLKKLSIDKFITYGEAPLISARLIICTPNLETFEITNVPYFFCSLDNVSSLTNVSLLFDDRDYAYMTNLDSVANLFKEALKQFHPAIQHVENVTLSNFCIKALGDLIKKQLVPRLWDAKFLKLHSYFDNHEEIVTVLEFFPKVKMLVLKDASCGSIYVVKSHFKFPPSFPNLIRVDVTWCKGDYSIFPLLEILLKYADNLEKMVFRVNGRPSKCCFYASQKLLRMQRASSTAKLFFCED